MLYLSSMAFFYSISLWYAHQTIMMLQCILPCAARFQPLKKEQRHCTTDANS
jgi:hypothetical protein